MSFVSYPRECNVFTAQVHIFVLNPCPQARVHVTLSSNIGRNNLILPVVSISVVPPQNSILCMPPLASIYI